MNFPIRRSKAATALNTSGHVLLFLMIAELWGLLTALWLAPALSLTIVLVLWLRDRSALRSGPDSTVALGFDDIWHVETARGDRLAADICGQPRISFAMISVRIRAVKSRQTLVFFRDALTEAEYRGLARLLNQPGLSTGQLPADARGTDATRA